MGNGFCTNCFQQKDEGNILIKTGNKLEKSNIFL